MKQLIILAIALLLSVAPAVAGTRAIELAPPSGSAQIIGIARTLDKGHGHQTFEVRADAAVREGTKLIVQVETEDRDGLRTWTDVATMQIRLGTAYMILDSRVDFSVAFPVSGILGVRVNNRSGRCMLEGTFETSGN